MIKCDFNQWQIAAVLTAWRLWHLLSALLCPAKRLTTQRAPSPDWGEDGGGQMRLDSTSGASRRLPLHPHQCPLPQLPCHPLRVPPSQHVVQEEGLAHTHYQSEGLRAKERLAAQKVRRLLIRNADDVAVKSTRLEITSLRKTSWRTESATENLTPQGRTVESQQVQVSLWWSVKFFNLLFPGNSL